MMKAITLSAVGDADVLQLSDVSMPTPTAEQLLIRVHATALNRADILQRRGKYPPPAGESEILGLEIAGEVVNWGNQVNSFVKGQRVFGLVAGGGYAEYCVLDQAMAMQMKEDWSYTYAAAIPEAFLTAYLTLFELGELISGESVLIHAAGSGVGTAGIQMAKYSGATVYGTAGSPEKIAHILELGADHGINYKTDDFSTVIMQLTRQQGVDVIQDFLGSDYFARNLMLLKIGGRLIQVATMRGAKAEIDLAMVMQKRLQIKGSTLRSRPLTEKRAITQRFAQRWLPVMMAGNVKPVIDSIYPLAEVRAAHRRMENNENFGKIVLTLD